MKIKTTTSEQLGITQIEAAMLLGIHRSQWSMFESGKRSLPTHALILLGEMHNHLKENEQTAKAPNPEHQTETKRQLEKLLSENKFRLLQTQRKIDDATKKRAAQSRMLQLSEFMANRETTKQSPEWQRSALDYKVTKASQPQKLAAFVALEIKHEMLAQQRQALEDRLKRLAQEIKE